MNPSNFCIFFMFLFFRQAKSTKIATNRFLYIKFRWVIFA